MNKRKLGAMLSVIGVAGAITATQFIDLDQTRASYLSLDFVQQAVEINDDFLKSDQDEADYYADQSKTDPSNENEEDPNHEEELPSKMASGQYSIDSQDIDKGLADAEAASIAAAEEKEKAEEVEKAIKENVKEKLFKGKVNVAELNARKAADTDSEIIGKLNEGDLVEGSLHDDWIEIELDGEKAFVSAEFVDPLEEDKEAQPSPEIANASAVQEESTEAPEPAAEDDSPEIDEETLARAREAQEEEENRRKAIEEAAIAQAKVEAEAEEQKKRALQEQMIADAKRKAADEAAKKRAIAEAAKKEAARKEAEQKAKAEAAAKAKAKKEQAEQLMADGTYSDAKDGQKVDGTICYDGVNVRKLPNLNSEVVATLPKDTPIQGRSIGGGWVQFRYNGKTCYVSSKMVKRGGSAKLNPNQNPAHNNDADKANNDNNQSKADKDNKNPQKPKLPETNPGAITGQFPKSPQGLVQAARAQLGKAYVLGAVGPGSYDCSGLTKALYNMVYGMNIPRSVSGQASMGTPVSKGNLQPGDLVFFNPNGNASSGSQNLGHVGIYIGGNRIIHASTPQTGVIESSLAETWYVNHYVCARRIL